MFGSRKLYVSLLGALAWSGTAADTVLSIVEAAAISTTQTSLFHIATVASALDAVSLCCVIFYIVQDVRRRDGFMERSSKARRVLVGVSVVLSSAALIVSLILIISINTKWDQVISTSSAGPVSNWDGVYAGHVVAWAVSCIGQIALYSSTFWKRHTPKLQPITVSGPRDSVMSQMRSAQPNSNMFTMKPAQPSSPLDNLGALPSPTYSTRSSQSLKSFRESIRYAVRPVTSRSTLISRPSFNRDARSIYSDAHSIDNVSHSDGFDSWDTSSVSNQARDAVMHAPSKGTPLDTIPGSRSMTPARALDGPFLPEIDEELAEEELVAPRMIPDVSRPPSPAVSEAHIHPLFRSESPIPPPEATPGTSIVASPLADQVIACPARPYNRMRSNSNLRNNTTSPSPLVPAQSFRGRALSQSAGDRTPSPPSREMTPPIPDFVLNSSPRSSLSGSRKVSLRNSPDR
ncbi:uncharacterized protein M421DRAFT_102218 [Didymella exigua CBS 183.55]|uniref:PalH-domain-containing protein n=1 Tax=Didymella exigua CBS 183.55 TaxID=1150837 RepID=A0A6A5REU8_9PLEO|nr:uncharacterized protein M421DRAFT_102218 [Didymella exigua CBS 183.55]KAF1926811.1 hypothetical protein M421DRAFT_102218 [Didymella exigua CBS 183.55]